MTEQGVAMNLYLEIFGYLGTALVLVSMLMTSLVRLRWFNLAGAVVSMLYALACRTWPVFVLNLSLAVINVVQLFRLARKKEETV